MARVPGGIGSRLSSHVCLRKTPLLVLPGRYSPEMPPSRMTAYTRFGAFCGNVGFFDAAAFRIAKSEAATMDPQHRLLLEVTAEALADGKVSSAAQTTGGFGAVLKYGFATAERSNSIRRVSPGVLGANTLIVPTVNSRRF